MNCLRMLFILVAIAFLGCDASHPTKFSSPEDLSRYAKLPFASATHDVNLQAELARILTEGGTPAQLAGISDSAASIDRSRNSIVIELNNILPAEIRDALGQRLRAVYPNDRFQFAPLVRGTARELLLSADNRRKKYQRLMQSAPASSVYQHALGVGADASYLAVVDVGNRLCGIQIAESLDANQIPLAVESLDVMFRACEWLVQEKHPVPRLMGAQKRGEALAALGAIARHPQATSEVHQQLLEILQRQLSNWPADANAWIGERAVGLHTYELVRDGYLLSLLPFATLRKWRDELGMEKLGKVVAENLDADELFFLFTMRKVIAACDQPFHQRESLFIQIQEDLERRRSSDQYPFVADQVLLADLVPRQRLIALDHARCLAGSVALTVATGGESPAEIINPLTGRPFSVIRVAGQVSVDGIGDDEPAIEVARLR